MKYSETDINRFLEAQESPFCGYEIALKEIQNGKKTFWKSALNGMANQFGIVLSLQEPLQKKPVFLLLAALQVSGQKLIGMQKEPLIRCRLVNLCFYTADRMAVLR